MTLQDKYLAAIEQNGGAELFLKTLRRYARIYSYENTFRFDYCVIYINMLRYKEHSIETDLLEQSQGALETIRYVREKAAAHQDPVLDALCEIFDLLEDYINGSRSLLA